METKKENTVKKTRVYNLIILDKSGSMESIRKEAIDGCNETIGSIRAAQKRHHDTQEHYISLAAFCDCGIDMIYDKTPIDDAEVLTWERYSPCCMTPLFDAIGKTVKRMETYTKSIEEFVDTSVLVTINTDGYENASKEWNIRGVNKLIKACKDQGWMFSFIGAGEEVVEVAAHISITNTVIWEQTSEGTAEIFENENQARDRFYMVRCGYGRAGIVMSGRLVGEPYCGEDWAGRGRKIYYMDMEPNYYVHTEKVPTYVSTEYLLRELPGFDWTGGKAGRVLPEALAEKLESIWARYTKKLHDEGSIDGERAAFFDWKD